MAVSGIWLKNHCQVKVHFYLNTKLCLEEFNVFCEVKRILSAVPYHVGVEDFIGSLEHLCQAGLVWGATKWTLQQPDQ